MIFPRLLTHALAFLEIFLFELDHGGNVKRQLRFAALAASTPIIESSIAMQLTSDFLLNLSANLYASGNGLCLLTSSYVIIPEKQFKCELNEVFKKGSKESLPLVVTINCSILKLESSFIKPQNTIS